MSLFKFVRSEVISLKNKDFFIFGTTYRVIKNKFIIKGDLTLYADTYYSKFSFSVWKCYFS